MSQPTIPPNRIFQIAYVVPDLEAAIQHYASELSVGGWIVFEKMRFAELKYRGRDSNLTTHTAMGCAGDVMYELIQQLDDAPSVYMDTVRSTGYGFHHFGMLSTSLDERIESYARRGFEIAMEVRAPNGARGCYIDTRSILPGMLEILQASDALMEFVHLPYAAARDLRPGEAPTIRRM